MRKLNIVPLVLTALLGCAKHEPTPQPSETIVEMVNALNRQDSAAFLNLLCSTIRQRYITHPAFMARTMEFWKSNNPTVQVLTQSHDSTVAIVTFHVTAHKLHPVDTTVTRQLYLEDGGWKLGY